MLEEGVPFCQKLAEGLKEKRREEDAEKVDKLRQQMIQDAPDARVALADKLDYISGFHVMDGADRVLVLEGLHKGALREQLLKICPKAKAGEVFPYTCLFNNRCSFKDRLYSYLAQDVRFTG